METIKADFKYCDNQPAHNRFFPELRKTTGFEEVKTKKRNPFPPK